MVAVTATHSKPRSMPDIAEYMTVKQAADKLGFHVITVRQLVRDGKLEGTKLPGSREWLILRKSVEKYLKETDGMSKNDPRRGQN
jgi:excisionase family DNA binding protein